jgi:hypothetical protein
MDDDGKRECASYSSYIYSYMYIHIYPVRPRAKRDMYESDQRPTSDCRLPPAKAHI